MKLSRSSSDIPSFSHNKVPFSYIWLPLRDTLTKLFFNRSILARQLLHHSVTMRFFGSSVAPVSMGAALVSANSATYLEARASCTFTSAAAIITGKGPCSTITLSNIAVPGGGTLGLTSLKTGTTVSEQP